MEVNHWMLAEDPAVQSEICELKEDSPLQASVPKTPSSAPLRMKPTTDFAIRHGHLIK
jgi:hypothetical protein